jgi:esterase/lipase
MCLLLPGVQSEDKALRLVNHMWHIMVREEGNEKINAEIAEWVLKRV